MGEGWVMFTTNETYLWSYASVIDGTFTDIYQCLQYKWLMLVLSCFSWSVLTSS